MEFVSHGALLSERANKTIIKVEWNETKSNEIWNETKYRVPWLPRSLRRRHYRLVIVHIHTYAPIYKHTYICMVCIWNSLTFALLFVCSCVLFCCVVFSIILFFFSFRLFYSLLRVLRKAFYKFSTQASCSA